MCYFLLQVECKKAQPKEVMLPANLAKTRAAGRGAYGELVLAGSRGATAAGTVRYAPYPVPVFPAGPALYHHHPATAALPKRFLIRPQPPPLAYAMTELLPIPTALDLTTVFPTLPQAIAL